MAKHAEDKKHNFLFIILIILFLVVIGIITYFYIIPYFSTKFNSEDVDTSNNNDGSINTIIEQTSATFKAFEDAPHLHSDEFNLVVKNDISTINGKIFNTSDEIVSNLNCLYTLKDINGDTVYEFTIYAKQIEPQDSFGFTSVILLDLSNVKDYSVNVLE